MMKYKMDHNFKNIDSQKILLTSNFKVVKIENTYKKGANDSMGMKNSWKWAILRQLYEHTLAEVTL